MLPRIPVYWNAQDVKDIRRYTTGGFHCISLGSTTKVSHPAQARDRRLFDGMVSQNAQPTIVSGLSWHGILSHDIYAGNAMLRSRFASPTPVHRTISKFSASCLNRGTYYDFSIASRYKGRTGYTQFSSTICSEALPLSCARRLGVGTEGHASR
jgi:hypothetical protein